MTPPPRMFHLALRLVRWLSPRGEREGIEGDLVETYRRHAARDDREACRWLRREIARSLLPLAALRIVGAPALRWTAGLALGILLTSFGPDAVVDLLFGVSTRAASGAIDPRAAVAAFCLAVVAGYWSTAVAGTRRVVGLIAIVSVLYGPAVVATVRSSSISAAEILPLLAIGATAFVGGLLGRPAPPDMHTPPGV